MNPDFAAARESSKRRLPGHPPQSALVVPGMATG